MSDPAPQPNPTPIDYQSPLTPGTIEMDPTAKQWGMIGHFSAFAGYIIPFGNIVGPLVVWQMKKAEIPFAADQAKESLNFQINVTVLILICLALMCVVIGFFLLPIVGIGGLVMTILAGIRANKGEYYRYPYIIRVIN